LASIPVTLILAGCACAGDETPAVASGELDKIAKEYKIEIVTAEPRFPVKNPHGAIDGKRAEAKALENYAGLFALEFNLYPPALVTRSKLKRVVLCSELSFAGQRRNAIPDFGEDTLYLDVSRGTYSKPYLRAVIHHEYYHIIDYQDDGSVYRDERWEALNPADFKYGSGGRNAQDVKTTSVLTDRYPGFLNHYSTTGVEEDKAEVFAHLIVNAARVEEQAKKDRVLQTKVGRMKELMAAFCADVNADFWGKARRLKRDDN
jgi:hypothetical protein